MPLAKLAHVCAFAYAVPVIREALPCTPLSPYAPILLILHAPRDLFLL